MLLARLCKALIRDGALTLIDADGTTHRFGRTGRAADVVVRLHDPSLHLRLPLDPYRALGDAYVDGTLTLERGDLAELLDLCARNLERLAARPGALWARALDWSARRVRQARWSDAPASAPRRELEDALVDCFRDWDRQYSGAYEADPRPRAEEVHEARMAHLAAKLLLRPGQRVLDVASGWGGLALHLAQSDGVDVTGLTGSAAQLAEARRRAAVAALSGQVRFHRRDVRQESGKYDRVIGVGVLERLGAGRRRELLARLRDLLTDDGVAVLCSVGRMDGPEVPLGWLRDYGLPGVEAPALSELVPAIERERLWVTDVEILRLQHADTLRGRRRRFVSEWEQVVLLHGDRFCRRWELTLALAEAGFRRGGLVVLQIQIARRSDAVPLTRGYMYEQGATGGGGGGAGIAA